MLNARDISFEQAEVPRSIVVVGGGLLGVSTAYFLVRAGHKVTVLDGGSAPGQGTSFANGGLLTPSMADPWNAPGVYWNLLKWLGREDAPMLLRPHALPSLVGWGLEFLFNSSNTRYMAHTLHNVNLANYSLEVLRKIRGEEDLYYEASTTGTIKLFRDAEALDRTEVFAHQCDRFEVERLDADGCVAREPALAEIRDEIVGGLYHPNDESGDALLYCEELARAASALGCEFQFSTWVTSLRVSGGRVSGVETDDDLLRPDVVVLAAGSESVELARTAGLRLPVKPAKGYSITFPVAEGYQAPVVPIVDDALHAAVTPLGDRIRVAGTAEFAGFDRSINQGRIDNLQQLLASIYPQIARTLDETSIEPWVGLRPMSASGIPIIGKTGIDGLFTNVGHGHLGWSMAAGSGKLLSDLISQTPLDLKEAVIQ